MPTEPHLFVDLVQRATDAAHTGPSWSHESTDLDTTLLTWQAPHAIAAHVNDEVDVIVIGVAGSGEVTVDGDVYMLSVGQMVLIPQHAERSLRCTEGRWSYLSVHRRRRGLWPTVGTRPPVPT